MYEFPTTCTFMVLSCSYVFPLLGINSRPLIMRYYFVEGLQRLAAFVSTLVFIIFAHTWKHSNLRMKCMCKTGRLLFHSTFQDTKVPSLPCLPVQRYLLVLPSPLILLSSGTMSNLISVKLHLVELCIYDNIWRMTLCGEHICLF